MKRKSLEERQREMRERQLQARRENDKRCKIDVNQVMELAGMAFGIRDIARELGCSEDALHADYRDAIEKGRERGGTLMRMVIWEKAMGGDIQALHYLFLKLNGEKLLLDDGTRKRGNLHGDPGRKARSQARKTLRKGVGVGQRKWTPTKIFSASYPSREISKRINNPDRIFTEDTFDKLQ